MLRRNWKAILIGAVIVSVIFYVIKKRNVLKASEEAGKNFSLAQLFNLYAKPEEETEQAPGEAAQPIVDEAIN
jgi:hypothetical protein